MKRETPRRRNAATDKILRKAFGGIEVEDAKEPLRIMPIAADFSDAVRKDPRNCGLSKCVKRMFGASCAVFFKTFAYVDMVDPDGKRRVKRYMTYGDAMEQLAAFDRGGLLSLGRSIILRPASPQQTLSSQRKRNLRWRRSDVGKAVTAERKAQSELRAATREHERTQTHLQEARAEESASSPKLTMAKKQAQAAHTVLRKARDRMDSVTERAKKLRTHSFRPGTPPKPRQYDLTVRNASGFFNGVWEAA